MQRLQRCAYAVAIVIALVAAGCGGGNSLPTGNSNPQPAAGATIQGTLVSDLTMSSSSPWLSIQNGGGGETPPPTCCSSSSSVSSQCCSEAMTMCYSATSRTGGIKVTVAGTTLSTTTDGSGHFTLTGISEGSVTLKFEGEGVSATITIGGLSTGQVLTLVVEVAGENAKLWKEGETEHELKFVGRIESVTPPTLVVSGKTVGTNGATSVRDASGAAITLADLRIGSLVKVLGTVGTDGTLLARVVALREEEHKGCESE